MTRNEKEALLHYLEFHLVKYVEELEDHINDSDVVSHMYERAYEILADIDTTLKNNSKSVS